MTAPRSPRPGTKAAAILRALRRSAGLTAATAFAYGETHLAATVRALRRAGHLITAEWQTGRTRYNEPARFKKYRAPLNQPK